MPEIDIGTARAGIEIIDYLQTGSRDAAQEQYRRWIGKEELQIWGRSGDVDTPPWVAFETDRRVDIFAAGVQNPIQSLNLALGYACARVPPMVAGANHFAAGWAKEIYEWPGVVVQGKPFRLFGHSAGGAIIEVLARAIYQFVPGSLILSINTYGSPSPGLPGVSLPYFTDNYRQRWMATGDPVPLVPAAVGISRVGRSIALGVVSAGGRPFHCVQPEGGLILGDNSIRVGSYPDGIDRIHAALQRWVDRDGETVRIHSPENYRQLLNAADERLKRELAAPGAVAGRRRIPPQRLEQGGIVLPLDGGPAPATPPPGADVVMPLDLARNLPPGGVGVAEATPAGVTLPNGYTVPVNVLRQNMGQARVGKSLRFFTVKVGTKWQVGYLDHIVATYNYPSAAKTLAKAGNRFLRLLGNRGGVHMPDFVDMWATFVSIASSGDPASYRPTLQVNP